MKIEKDFEKLSDMSYCEFKILINNFIKSHLDTSITNINFNISDSLEKYILFGSHLYIDNKYDNRSINNGKDY